MGGGGGQPDSPSPGETSAANKETARYNTEMSFVDQYGPSGSYTYRKIQEGNGDTAPRYALDVNLSPEELAKQQGLNNIQLQLLGLGQSQFGRVGQAVAQPFNWQAAPAMPGQISATTGAGAQNYGGLQTTQSRDYSGLAGGDPAARQAATEAASKYLTYGYDDRFANQQRDLTAQLAAQGLRPGTEAYNRAMSDYNQARDQAYERAGLQAYTTGLGELESGVQRRMTAEQMGLASQQQAYGQAANIAQLGLQGQNQAFNQQQAALSANAALRQRAIEEQAYARSLPLNELSAIISGTQVNMPNFTPISTASAAQQPYYQGGGGGGSNWTSDLMGLGGSLGSAAIMSGFSCAKKLKDNFKSIGSVLDKIMRITVEKWTYKADSAKKEHIGPYAEDWHREFGGEKESIDIVSAFGVCLKGIQELKAENERLKARIESLEGA